MQRLFKSGAEVIIMFKIGLVLPALTITSPSAPKSSRLNKAQNKPLSHRNLRLKFDSQSMKQVVPTWRTLCRSSALGWRNVGTEATGSLVQKEGKQETKDGAHFEVTLHCVNPNFCNARKHLNVSLNCSETKTAWTELVTSRKPDRET